MRDIVASVKRRKNDNEIYLLEQKVGDIHYCMYEKLYCGCGSTAKEAYDNLIIDVRKEWEKAGKPEGKLKILIISDELYDRDRKR